VTSNLFRVGLLVAVLAFLADGFSGYCAPQQKTVAANPTLTTDPVQAEKANLGDPIEALAGKWDIQCGDKGCMMFTDVLIGDSDHPANPKHPEYITIAVAINRSDRKPAYFAFHVPANADHSKGVIITFAKTMKEGVNWKMVVDENAMSQLDFNSCDQESCVARVHSEILSSDGSPNIDLLERFLNSDHVLFLYTKKGKSYRTMKALFPFQRAYQHLMETELKQAVP
jgi:invasion protein IalB